MRALETVCTESMKCIRVRAFLVSSPFIGEQTGKLLFLQRSAGAGFKRHASALQCRSGNSHGWVDRLID